MRKNFERNTSHVFTAHALILILAKYFLDVRKNLVELISTFFFISCEMKKTKDISLEIFSHFAENYEVESRL